MSKKRAVKHRIFRTLLSLFVVFAISMAAAVFAADVYPTKPVRLIVPWPAGGITDTVGRLIANKLSERLGKQVVVENRAGASGIIGAEATAKASPDGYTLLVVQDAHVIQPAVKPASEMPYDLIKDFTPIAKIGNSWFLLIAHPSLPANSLKEFIALAKQKPGQLIFAGLGSKSIVHLSAELLKMKADIDFKIVQFKGGAPAFIDVLGGHSQVTMGTISSNMPHFQSGKLKPLAICAPKRSVLLPDVPSTAEEGAPWYEAGIWWGFVAPAGTPAPIVNRLNKELKVILASDDVKKWFLSRGIEVDYQGPAELGTFMKEQLAKWADVVKKANIKWD